MDPGYIFDADDLNFGGYQTHQLRPLCEHNLPLRTRFPKLVLVLAKHPLLLDWLSSQKLNHLGEEEIVERLLNCVKAFSVNFQGNLVRRQIDISEEEFWKVLVDAFLKDTSPILRRKSHRKQRSVWV